MQSVNILTQELLKVEVKKKSEQHIYYIVIKKSRKDRKSFAFWEQSISRSKLRVEKNGDTVLNSM